MPDDRIYWLDHDNHIRSADDLTIDTDEAALAAAHWARVRKRPRERIFLTDGSRLRAMRLRGSDGGRSKVKASHAFLGSAVTHEQSGSDAVVHPP